MKPWAVHAFKPILASTVMVMVLVLCVHAAPALAHSMLVKAEPPRRARAPT